ncbi:MAG TPA: PAS domain-containing protein, partial [Chitinophagales bacterium]|nr:PAS domain-containing protein [Chitinophagales bacterium]
MTHAATHVGLLTNLDMAVFEAMPGCTALIQADAPVYTLLAATRDYLDTTKRSKEELIGKSLFEAFPQSPDDAEFNGEANLRASFQKVIASKDPHQLPVQRYDIPMPDGTFDVRYWRAVNKPVPGPDGRVAYIVHTAEDITQTVASEQREEKMKGMEAAHNLFMQAPVAITILKGAALTIELANEPVLALWGKDRSVIGKDLMDVLPEVKAQGFVDLLNAVRDSGVPNQVYEQPVTLMRNGQADTIYINSVYQPYYENGTAQPVGVLSIGHDVTDRVLAKKALTEKDESLRESEQRVRALVESAPFPIGVYVGKEMRIELANQTMLDLWAKGNDVVGKRYSEVLPELDNQQIFEQLDAVYTTGVPFHARHQRVDLVTNGRLRSFYFNYSFTPLYDAQGRVYGVMNTGADVTDLNLAFQKAEKSEQNLRNTIVQAPVPMAILTGPEHVVAIANERMYELWGKPADVLLHRPIFEGLPEAKNQGYEALLGGVYNTGETFVANELSVMLPRKDGLETVFINLLYEPYREADGSVSGIIAVATDVTAQVLARRRIEELVAERTRELAVSNESLVKVNAELARSNADLQQFAFAASHDLKEPVRKILTFNDRLQTGLGDRLTEKEAALFQRLEASAHRMNLLIDDLLTYSQVSLGAVAQEPVNMNAVL